MYGIAVMEKIELRLEGGNIFWFSVVCLLYFRTGEKGFVFAWPWLTLLLIFVGHACRDEEATSVKLNMYKMALYLD